MRLPHPLRPLVSCLSALVLAMVPLGADAQSTALGDPGGPGQVVARPAAECPRTIACQYAERTFLPDGYRIQSLQVCGANCTTRYWVSTSTDDQQILALDPVRGGAVIAVRPSMPTTSAHPEVRVVGASYGSGDPACCPSSYTDTTYIWDDASGVLVSGSPQMTSAADFPGWDQVRQELQVEGWQLSGV